MNRVLFQLFRAKILLISNAITILILIGLLFFEKYPQRIYNRIDAYISNRPLLKPRSYLDNQSFIEQTDFHSIYTGNRKIVMLGNSLTFRMNWSELLNRPDVANRGIGSDITAGFVNRLHYIINLKPVICFIEGGVNDLGFNIHPDTTIHNFTVIINRLRSHHINPVLTTITYVSASYPDAEQMIQKIKALNDRIIKLANDMFVPLIDLNKLLSDGQYLKSEYAVKDGIHFTGKAYLIWKREILGVLEKEKI